MSGDGSPERSAHVRARAQRRFLCRFHTFTPAAEGGYRLELVPSAHVPLVGVWHRMQVVANENAFDVFIGEPGGPLHHCASWQDRLRTFRQGAVGVWEHGGEAGEYRALRVETLTHQDA